MMHAVCHSALARQHNAVSRPDSGRVRGNSNRSVASRDRFERLGNGAEIPAAVVNDDDLLHNVPFVDGITPDMRGSGSSAMRSARPKALKIVSA